MHKISLIGPLGLEDTSIKMSHVSHWESGQQFSWNNFIMQDNPMHCKMFNSPSSCPLYTSGDPSS